MIFNGFPKVSNGFQRFLVIHCVDHNQCFFTMVHVYQGFKWSTVLLVYYESIVFSGARVSWTLISDVYYGLLFAITSCFCLQMVAAWNGLLLLRSTTVCCFIAYCLL